MPLVKPVGEKGGIGWYYNSEEEAEIFFFYRGPVLRQIERLYGQCNNPIYIEISSDETPPNEKASAYLSTSEQPDDKRWLDLCGAGCYELFTLPVSTPHEDVKTLTNPSGDTASDASLHWAMAKINECNEFHVACKEVMSKCPEHIQSSFSKKTPIRPARILDLGHFKEDNPAAFGGIKLVAAGSKTTPYACLSHCWGKNEDYAGPLSTNSTTLREFHDSISFAALPKTFKDAIVFTHRLGISYLWIDSLCIIQDSRSDWAVEACKMAEIFSNCYVALCATVSQDGRGGLFRKSEMINRTHLVSLRSGTQVNIRPKTRHPSVTELQMTGPEEEAFPLLTRGWVLQEVLLAPRLIHFGEELVWECSEKRSCECSAFNGQSQKGRYIFNPENEIYRTPFEPPVSTKTHWHNLVSRFSGLGLSVSSDRLPAMTGLAKHMQMFRQGRYLAGLWEDSIIDDLLWYCDVSSAKSPEEFPVTRRPPSTTNDPNNIADAPSWSWATMKCKVSFGRGYSLPVGKLLEAHCSPVDQDEYGAIKDGSLFLEGCLIAAKITQITDFGAGNTAIWECVNSPWERKSTAILDGRPQELGYSLYFLPLAGDNDRVTSYAGPLLQCLDAKEQIYQRVGFCPRVFDIVELWMEKIPKSVIKIV